MAWAPGQLSSSFLLVSPSQMSPSSFLPMPWCPGWRSSLSYSPCTRQKPQWTASRTNYFFLQSSASSKQGSEGLARLQNMHFHSLLFPSSVPFCLALTPLSFCPPLWEASVEESQTNWSSECSDPSLWAEAINVSYCHCVQPRRESWPCTAYSAPTETFMSATISSPGCINWIEFSFPNHCPTGKRSFCHVAKFKDISSQRICVTGKRDLVGHPHPWAAELDGAQGWEDWGWVQGMPYNMNIAATSLILWLKV